MIGSPSQKHELSDAIEFNEKASELLGELITRLEIIAPNLPGSEPLKQEIKHAENALKFTTGVSLRLGNLQVSDGD